MDAGGIMFCLEGSGGSAVVELVPSHHGSWVRIPVGVGLFYSSLFSFPSPEECS